MQQGSCISLGGIHSYLSMLKALDAFLNRQRRHPWTHGGTTKVDVCPWQRLHFNHLSMSKASLDIILNDLSILKASLDVIPNYLSILAFLGPFPPKIQSSFGIRAGKTADFFSSIFSLVFKTKKTM